MSLFRYAAGVAPRDYGLRWYQAEAKAEVERQLAMVRATMVVLATGMGKTTLFGAVAGDWPGDVLILAHRDELVRQAQARVEAMTGEMVEVEQADLRASSRARIVVASVQTLMRQKRLDGFARDRFSLIVVDELHHYTAPSFRRPLEYFDAKVLGVTATPDRADGAAIGKIIDSVAYSLDIADGIEQGYLVPIKGKTVRLGVIDLSGVKTQAGDLMAGQLDEEMVKACGAIVDKTLELAGDRCGPAFFPGVKSAELACSLFNARQPGSAAFVSASTDPVERRDIMLRVKRGQVRWLCNVGIATEGFDWPEASAVILGRPTKSRSLYTQMVGRGTRVLPGVVDGVSGKDGAIQRRGLVLGSQKPDCLVLDFTDTAGAHSLIGPEDLLGGRYSDAEVETAKKKRRSNPALAPSDALEEARRELRELAARVRVTAAAEVRDFDPFNAVGLDREALENQAMKFGYVPATQGQRDFLKRKGVEPEDLQGMSKFAAHKLIDRMIQRQNKKLATANQLRLLESKGIPVPRTATFEQASNAISYIASKSWKFYDKSHALSFFR